MNVCTVNGTPTTKEKEMGMDVFGVNPKNEKGEYFRNNVWWWRPLAEFVCEKYPDIAEKCEYWQSNDGDGLDDSDATALAQRIRVDIALGVVKEYETQINEWRASLPREACKHCDATGIRADKVGKEMGMPEKELSAEVAILTGRTHGWCNGCDGVGTTESWMAGYPFSEENVIEFAEFLENCGGFQIC
jgi:hypothetical protein